MNQLSIYGKCSPGLNPKSSRTYARAEAGQAMGEPWPGHGLGSTARGFSAADFDQSVRVGHFPPLHLGKKIEILNSVQTLEAETGSRN